jgi:hypothetical protein
MIAVRLASLRQNSLIRKSMRILLPLFAVLVAFAIGIGIYAAALALWPLLLVWWPWLLAGAVAVLALGAWWLWWRLPKWQVNRLRMTIRDAKARADVEDNFRKTIGQLLGGAAVLLGAGFAYLQFQQQQQTSRLQSEQQQKAARELLISNQVAKGFELLGNKEKDITMRLGGIYSLEGVINTSEDYYRPIVEALCAFVRDNTKTNTGENAPSTDVQAALTVIGRRRAIGETDLNLRNVNIPKANLYSANLANAALISANLTDAHLSGTILRGAFLTNANLSGASLSGADLALVYLSGASAKLLRHLA